MRFPFSTGILLKPTFWDTIKAGKYLNDRKTVWSIISKASEAYDLLTSLGLKFETSETEGGHSFPRVFTIKNETGKHVTRLLYLRAKELGVNFVKGHVEELAVKRRKTYIYSFFRLQMRFQSFSAH